MSALDWLFDALPYVAAAFFFYSAGYYTGSTRMMEKWVGAVVDTEDSKTSRRGQGGPPL